MGGFVGGQAAGERFDALADQVDAAYAEMRELSSDGVGNEFRTRLVERLETQERANRGLMYRFFGQIADPPRRERCGGGGGEQSGRAAADPAAGSQAPHEARRAVEPTPASVRAAAAPELEHVAEAVAGGRIGEDHLRVIARAIDVLPSCVSATDRDDVQRSLVREAVKNDAEVVRALAGRIDEIFNPDGDFDEEDRARRRGLLLGAQGRDGMSRLSGYLDPEARAYLEAVTAAVRPGRHLPDGTMAEIPDQRSSAERCHDGLKLGLKAGIASGGSGRIAGIRSP